MATPELTSCFAAFVNAHQLTTKARKHKKAGLAFRVLLNGRDAGRVVLALM